MARSAKAGTSTSGNGKEILGGWSMEYLTMMIHGISFILLILIITEIVRGLKELWSDFS